MALLTPDQIAEALGGPKATTAFTPTFDARDISTWNLIKGGAARSIEALKGTAMDLVPALGASLIGQDESAKEDLKRYADRMAAIEEEHPTAYKSYKDVLDPKGHLLGYAGETLGELGPDLVSFLLGSGVGSFIGKKVGTTLAKKALEEQIESHVAKAAAEKGLSEEATEAMKDRLNKRALDGWLLNQAAEHGASIGSKVGLFGMAEATSVPDTLNSIYQDTGNISPGVALTVGSLVGALNTYLPTSILEKLGSEGTNLLATKMLDKSELVPTTWKREYANEVLKGTATLGGIGAAQQSLNILADQLAGSKDPFFTPQHIDSIIESSVKGATGGLGTMLPLGVLSARSKVAQRNAEIAAQKQKAIDSTIQQAQEALTAKEITPPPAPTAPPAAGFYPPPERIEPYVPPLTKTGFLGEQGFYPKQVPDVSPEPSTTPAPITAEALSEAGLNPKKSTLAKQLIDKDPMNPDHVESIDTTLGKIRNRVGKEKAGIDEGVARAVHDLAGWDYDTGKQKEIAPVEGVTDAELRATPDIEASREGVSVPSEPERVGAAPGVTEPETGGVAAATEPLARTGVGEAAEPRALEEAPKEAAPEPIPEAVPAKEVPVAEEKPAPKKERAPKEAKLPKQEQEILDRLKEIGEREPPEERVGEVEVPTESEKPTAPFTIPKEYKSFFEEDPTTPEDRGLITEALKKPEEPQKRQKRKGLEAPEGPTQTELHKALSAYFTKMPRTIDGLINIAFDLAFETKRFRREGETAKEARFFNGMDYKNARIATDWLHNNLSPETDKVFRDVIRRFEISRKEYTDEDMANAISDSLDDRKKKEKEVDETIQSYLDAAAAENKGRKLMSGPVHRLAHEVHPAVSHALMDGDLQGALRFMSAGDSSSIGHIAGKLLGKSPDTRVRVKLGLVDEGGKPVPGYFDPKTNTIYIDRNTGMNSHVILHEVTHSVMSHALDDPNNLLTRHLTQIYDAAKNKLGTAYGARDVHEFASEAWSNPDFASKLKQITPEGSSITLWDRFSRAVTNFVRRLLGMESKPLQTAFDEVDHILDQLASPAPNKRGAGAFYAADTRNKQRKIFSFTDKLVDQLPFFNDSQKGAISKGIRGSTDAVTKGIQMLLPTHALGEIADDFMTVNVKGRAIKLGSLFNQLINERSGFENSLNKKGDAFWDKAKKVLAENLSTYKDFCKVVHDSTLLGVDPTKHSFTYKGRFDENGNDMREAWADVNDAYKKLPKAWQDMYSTLRDAYQDIYDNITKAVQDRIDSTDAPDSVKLKTKKEIMAKLLEQGVLDPYFALGRRGDYWLGADWVTKEGQKAHVVKAFKSTLERSKFMEEVSKTDRNARLEPYESVKQVDYRRTPAGSIINSLFHILETNNVPETAKEELMRMFLSTLPETALMNSFKRRKGTLGFEENVLDTFMHKLRGSAHQIANIRYNHKLGDVVDAMQQHAVQVGKGIPEVRDENNNIIRAAVPAKDNSKEVGMAEEFRKHLSYVMNPTKNSLGNALNSAAFTYTLGFNLSSGIVQLANIPMVVVPYLNGEYTKGNVSRAIGNATRMFMGSGTKAQMEYLGGKGATTEMNVGYSLANYRPGADGKTNPTYERYKTLIDYAEKNGQLNRSQLYEVLNVDPRGGFMDKANALAGMPMHYAERMNREVTLMATYDLEMERIASGDKTVLKKLEQFRKELSEDEGRDVDIKEASQRYAAKQAVYMAELTNGSISAAAAPRISHSTLGKVAFMYKRWAATYYYALFKSLKDIYKNESPEARARGMKQLGGTVGMAALMSGAQGIPLYGLFSMVYDLFRDDDDEDAHTVTRKAIGELPYKGLIDYTTNLSVAARISPNDLIIRDNPGSGGSRSFAQQIAEIVGGPAYGVADRVMRGLDMVNQGNVERGVESLLPAAMGNVFKAYRFATEGTKTLRGDPITGEVAPGNIMALSLGFAPADYTFQSEMNAQYKGINKSIQQKVSRLKEKYYVAYRNGDTETMQDITQDLLKVGAKHPGLEINGGTISDVLERSLKAQEQATQEMLHGVRYSKKMLQEIRSDMQDWGE